MGQEGVLVGKKDATWAWAPVGKYVHNELAQAGLMGYLTLFRIGDPLIRRGAGQAC